MYGFGALVAAALCGWAVRFTGGGAASPLTAGMSAAELLLSLLLYAQFRRTAAPFSRAWARPAPPGGNADAQRGQNPESGARAKRNAAIVLLMIAAILASSGLPAILLSLVTGGRSGTVVSPAESGRPEAWFLQFVYLVLVSPAFEELAARGMMFAGFREDLGFPAATAASTILWAVWHGNVAQGLCTLLLGPALCLLYEGSGTLLLPVALHMLNNFLSYLSSRGILTISFGQDTPSRLVIAAALAGIYGWLFFRLLQAGSFGARGAREERDHRT